MNTENAFIGRSDQPTEEDLAEVLGSSASVWKHLLDWLAIEHSVSLQEWKSYSLKSGWSLKVKRKKRTILYLAPEHGCFGVALVLGDRAVKAAKQCSLPKTVLEMFDHATRYPEGTGLRLTVSHVKDLAPVQILTEVKLAN